MANKLDVLDVPAESLVFTRDVLKEMAVKDPTRYQALMAVWTRISGSGVLTDNERFEARMKELGLEKPYPETTEELDTRLKALGK